ncbi:hypothetical protein BCR35DRAFT_349776 [Leucosporidium creatinivorum]|uniref:NmrA-like domain-containing protein n=1 Tax=Leucosporidium creatinivorum TaxID=106004 RepID=A0A1Y2G1V4_9BASI|nr:hypothetical protein BCR35DRAFT_349776 [Leucosporidium creatinivorum]
MPSELPIAVVVHATGTQGLSATRALSHASYHVRALTLHPEQAESKFKTLQNVEVIPYDWSRKSLEQAFEGGEPAKLVFALALSDDKAMMGQGESEGWPSEYYQGELLARVAKEKGVKVFIWSSSPPSPSKYSPISAFDDKAEVEKYLQSTGQPFVALHLGTFLDYFVGRNAITYEGANLVLTFPRGNRTEAVYPFISVEHDLGAIILLIAEKFESAQLSGRRLVCCDKFYSLDDLTEIIEKIAARKVILRTKLPCGKENSPGDKLFQCLGDSATPLKGSATSAAPFTLSDLGCKLQPVEGFVKERLLPFLGLKRSEAAE